MTEVREEIGKEVTEMTEVTEVTLLDHPATPSLITTPAPMASGDHAVAAPEITTATMVVVERGPTAVVCLPTGSTTSKCPLRLRMGATRAVEEREASEEREVAVDESTAVVNGTRVALPLILTT